jgi:glucose-1-phosphate cytidylyltransferase
MKAVILAGGYGTRISEETHLKPKPMIEIGGKPILWHIMKIYSHYGINEFVICCGYKAELIQEYIQKLDESWTITPVDTGINTMTGGRLKLVKKYVENETFCFTYGDTLNNVKIDELVNFHFDKKVLATVTACKPPEKYGLLKIENEKVVDFQEKPHIEGEWVNGGFFVLNPQVFDYIKSDSTVWEKEPMEKLTKDGQLSAYKHRGFYQPMDTISDKNHLEKLWQNNEASWKVW